MDSWRSLVYRVGFENLLVAITTTQVRILYYPFALRKSSTHLNDRSKILFELSLNKLSLFVPRDDLFDPNNHFTTS